MADSLAIPYRTALAQQGLAPLSLYSGDRAFSGQVQKLVTAAGGGSVVNADGPNLPIPGKEPSQAPAQVTDNTAVIDPGPGTATGSGIGQWVKDNPGKSVAIAIAAVLLISELSKKGK